MKKLMCVAAAMAAFLWCGRPAHADTSNASVDATAAADLVARVNDLRAGIGLPVLTVDAELAAKATAWTRTMAGAGRIWHSVLSDGVTADWARLGENVGMASSVDALHRAFVDSPRHYENLVSPDFESIGIGVARVDGTLFATEVFMRRHPVRSPEPAPAKPVASSASAPVPATVPVSRRRGNRRPAPAAKTATIQPAAARTVAATTSGPTVPPPASPGPPVRPPQPMPADSSNTSRPEMQLAASHATAAGWTWTVAAGMAGFMWAAVTMALAVAVRPGRWPTPTRRRRPLTQRELRRLVGPIPAGSH